VGQTGHTESALRYKRSFLGRVLPSAATQGEDNTTAKQVECLMRPMRERQRLSVSKQGFPTTPYATPTKETKTRWYRRPLADRHGGLSLRFDEASDEIEHPRADTPVRPYEPLALLNEPVGAGPCARSFGGARQKTLFREDRRRNLAGYSVNPRWRCRARMWPIRPPSSCRGMNP